MPRARSEKSIKAETLYHSGKKLVDIARDLGVPDSTVRRWKSDQDWDKKKNETKKNQTERSGTKTTMKPNARKRGAQPGHPPQGGAKRGNINAVTHGAYMKIYSDLLTDEEKELLPVLNEQEERDQLRSLYAQHQITERRLMKFIKEILDGAEMITFRTVSQIEPSGKKAPDGREITKIVKISQEQETRKEQLRNFTDALTRVRAEMRRTADSLRQLAAAEAKNNTNEGNAFQHTQGEATERTDPYEELTTEELKKLLKVAEADE